MVLVLFARVCVCDLLLYSYGTYTRHYVLIHIYD